MIKKIHITLMWFYIFLLLGVITFLVFDSLVYRYRFTPYLWKTFSDILFLLMIFVPILVHDRLRQINVFIGGQKLQLGLEVIGLFFIILAPPLLFFTFCGDCGLGSEILLILPLILGVFMFIFSMFLGINLIFGRRLPNFIWFILSIVATYYFYHII